MLTVPFAVAVSRDVTHQDMLFNYLHLWHIGRKEENTCTDILELTFF